MNSVDINQKIEKQQNLNIMVLNFNLRDLVKGLLVSIQNLTEFEKERLRKSIFMKI